MSHHGPGDGGAVVGCRAAAQLVYEDERVRGGVAEDGPGLLNIKVTLRLLPAPTVRTKSYLELHQEGALSTKNVV